MRRAAARSENRLNRPGYPNGETKPIFAVALGQPVGAVGFIDENGGGPGRAPAQTPAVEEGQVV